MTALFSAENCSTIEFLASLTAGLTVTRYFYTICMMESRAPLPCPLSSKGYTETAVLIFPRQMVFTCTSVFQAARSPFLGTKALLFTFITIPLLLLLHQPDLHRVRANSLKTDTALLFQLTLE